ncbi:hypothetical protein BKA56DRAFT_619242 [Ilyonectria sp. MPI-CAGE-AT-0026]|nr:hypothetical protein BKA56DRAFT_619242 [Ilyonectria sp. MPI-CAGE-AT-0026]
MEQPPKSNGEQGPNLPLNDYLEEAQNLPVPPETSGIPPLIRERPPRRKGVNVWTCSRQCICGHDGMKVNVDPCPHCHTPRCAYCKVYRIRERSSNPPLPVDETDPQTNAG